MRFSIFSYSQERMMELGIDVLDALILNWFAIFFAGKMHKQTFVNQAGEEKIYGWVQISKIKEDLPSIGITSDRGIEKRLEKLVSRGILERYTIQTANGKRSYYATTEIYDSLINKDWTEKQRSSDIESMDDPTNGQKNASSGGKGQANTGSHGSRGSSNQKSQANSGSYGSQRSLFEECQANSGSHGQANTGSYGSNQANTGSGEANSGSHAQANSGSHALNKYMTSDIKTNDSLIIFPEEKNKKEPFLDFLSDGQKEFAQLVYNVLDEAGLPDSGSFITFLQRDFKLGLSTLHANRLGLHTGDILQAVKNYAEVKKMSSEGISSWNRFSPFNIFCKENIITNFLPGNFDRANFVCSAKSAPGKSKPSKIALKVL